MPEKPEKADFGEVQQGTALPQRCVSMPRIDRELATDCVVSKNSLTPPAVTE